MRGETEFGEKEEIDTSQPQKKGTYSAQREIGNLNNSNEKGEETIHVVATEVQSEEEGGMERFPRRRRIDRTAELSQERLIVS